MKAMSRSSGGRAEEALSLSRVLGLTALHGSSLASTSQLHLPSSLLSFDASAKHKANDLLFYAAGSVVVAYSSHDNDQKAFYASAGHQPVSCVAVSSDGHFLAIGERGHRPCIAVWDLVKQERVAVLSGHQHGVSCLAFCPRGRYLVSAGFQHDKTLRLWDWAAGRLLSTQRLSNKVYALACDPDGEFFITAGEKHLKWWYLTEVLDGEAAGLEGKPAGILEDMRRSVFVDIVCGGADKVFCITQQGLLCQFNANERVVEKVVQVKANVLPAYSLELLSRSSEKDKDDVLFVGCANGVVQAFSASTLEHIVELPRPGPLRPDDEDHEDLGSTQSSASFGACYALRQVPSTLANPLPKLCAIYADRSMCVWDLSELQHAMPYRSFTAHRSTVWDVHFLHQQASILGATGTADVTPRESSNYNNSSSSGNKPLTAGSAPLPQGTFITCSADDSVRFWNLDTRARRSSRFKSSFSRDMLHAFSLHDGSESNANKSFLREGDSVIASTATGLSLTHTGQTGSEFDFSRGLPDVELPVRSLSPSAPRVIAVHPSGTQLAVGDTTGRLTVFDLRTMQSVFSTQAHSAEILSLAFSPPLTSHDDGESWVLHTEDTESSADEKALRTPLVLLATAGRDRLIHIFDASLSPSANGSLYSPLDTLDHHSASVTALRFTADGQKLLSCGGDKTMVLCAVRGRKLNPLKTIATPTATIQGVSVDPSSKFAVSAGQDARLGIWNLHSGKCLRTYKPGTALPSTRYACSRLSSIDDEMANASVFRPNPASSALYKTELDPSGSFIATCAFDKSISLLDFFSGERLGSVSGHGELVTNLRFSPDGRQLVTVGGEGCVFVWQLAPSLVQSMRDRLSELCASAQRRIARASASVSSSVSASGTATTSSVSSVPVPQSSLTNLKQKMRQQSFSSAQSSSEAPLPSSIVSPAVSVSASSSTGVRKNRWLERDSPYQIGGRRVDTSNDPSARHKLTLELTAASITPEKEERMSSLAATLAEDRDDVMQAALSEEDEEEEDTDESNAAAVEEEYAQDFEPTVDTEREKEDADLAEARRKIDTLEKTAGDLESWLEQMLRNEATLDPSSTKIEVEEAKNPLNPSLSTAFFRSAKSAPPVKDTGDDLLPPPPVLGEPLSAEELESQQQARKLRESAATLAQMRERLRAMDQFDQSGAPASDVPSETTTTTTTTTTTATKASEEAAPMLLPPPPPTREEERARVSAEERLPPDSTGVVDEDELFATPTDSENELEETECRPLPALTVSAPSTSIALPHSLAQLREKTNRYKQVLSDLERAKEAAAASFRELQALRSSLSMSVDESAILESSSDNSLAHSLRETEMLLAQFRSSLSIADSPRFETSTSTLLSSVEASNLLEKYSDQLLDLVAEKMRARLTQT